MKHHTKLIAIFSAISAMLLAPSAFAQGGGHGPRGHHRGGPHGQLFGPRIAEALELDEAQQQQLQALRAEMREDLAPAHEDLRELRTRLRELWSADAPDRAAILAVGEQIDALHGVIQGRQTELRLAALQILTPEQRATLAERRSERGERMGRRGQGDGGEPGARMGRGHGRRGGHGMAGRLDLTDEQQAQAQALRQASRESLQPLMEQMRELRGELRSQWSAAQPDAQAIEALQARIDTLEDSIRVQRVDSRLAFLELLTAEQRAAMREMPRRGHRR